MLLATKQAISIKLATTARHFLRDLYLYFGNVYMAWLSCFTYHNTCHRSLSWTVWEILPPVSHQPRNPANIINEEHACHLHHRHSVHNYNVISVSMPHCLQSFHIWCSVIVIMKCLSVRWSHPTLPHSHIKTALPVTNNSPHVQTAPACHYLSTLSQSQAQSPQC